MQRPIPEGYSYWIDHYAAEEDNAGKTIATIIDPNGKAVAMGYSICSTKDTFSRKIGRDIATGRANKMFNELWHNV